ncbi:MAG TPA: flagellar basal body P-ring formation chaperone FlgA [Pseudolabrys sp.]|nr:flagellar basal body P-ring formation chaperone FlgA [Pseudolabrys sp.]
MTLRISFIALAACLAFAGAAAAQETTQETPPSTPHPVLRAEATVNGDIVRIGDLVDHAGIIAKVPIFRAPDLGYTGSVSAEEVADAVRRHALIGLDTGNVTEVRVTRAARTIPASAFEQAVAHALAAQYNLGPLKDVTVTFDRDLRAMYVEPSARGEPRVARITYDERDGRFDATLEIPTGATARGTLRLAGRAQATTEVLTVARQIERGTVLKDADVMVERRPRADVARDMLTDRDQAVGLAARAVLQPGRPLRGTELMRPQVVQRDDVVTLMYEVPGIKLTMRGKATEAGAVGDTISVLNEQTKRVVQATVAGPGRVIIDTTAPRLAANLPPGRARDNAAARVR